VASVTREGPAQGELTGISHKTDFNVSDINYVLTNSSDASILQTSEYCEILKQHGYKVFSVVLYDDGLPVSCIMGRYMSKFNITRTIGIGGLVGGCPVVIDGVKNKAEIQAASIQVFNEAVLKMNVGSIHLCTPPASTEDLFNILKANGYDYFKCKYSPILDISIGKDELWRTIDRKNRNVIRYAIKNGVTIENENSNENFNDFYRLYSQTADRKRFKPNPFNEMQSQYGILSKNGLGDLWMARKDGEIVAGAFIWKFKDTIYYAYGASSKKGWNCKASNLLNWELITKYSAENYRYYNMWEGSTDKSSPLYNMTAFKLSFGAKMVPTHEFIRVNKKLLNFVLSLPPKALLKNVYQCN